MSSTSGLVAENLLSVLSRIRKAVEHRSAAAIPRLVAVSKTKSVDMVLEAYNAGQRHFGENYVQEMVEKAEKLPRDIQWHFIGHLQSRKCKSVAETVDSEKLAAKLNLACAEVERSGPLRVMVQVNTSAEESKFGVEPRNAGQLAKFIVDNCPKLQLIGLMTIGSFSDEPSPECFEVLIQCREQTAAEIGVSPESLELSMGMSTDFELAISKGSTNIRVGSTIFGSRAPPK